MASKDSKEDKDKAANAKVEKAPSACTKCCEWYGKTPVGHFLSSRSAHTFNLVFAHLLFWTLAVPLVATNGYVTTNYAEAIAAQGTYGEIASGRWGQGCFPIVLAVTTIATLIWLESLVRYCKEFGCSGKPVEE